VRPSILAWRQETRILRQPYAKHHQNT